jgi:hypothetical protein
MRKTHYKLKEKRIMENNIHTFMVIFKNGKGNHAFFEKLNKYAKEHYNCQVTGEDDNRLLTYSFYGEFHGTALQLTKFMNDCKKMYSEEEYEFIYV